MFPVIAVRSHLDVHAVGHGAQRLQVKLRLIGPLGVPVQRVDQPLRRAPLTHAGSQLRALKVQIPQTVRVRIRQTEAQNQSHTDTQSPSNVFKIKS